MQDASGGSHQLGDQLKPLVLGFLEDPSRMRPGLMLGLHRAFQQHLDGLCTCAFHRVPVEWGRTFMYHCQNSNLAPSLRFDFPQCSVSTNYLTFSRGLSQSQVPERDGVAQLEAPASDSRHGVMVTCTWLWKTGVGHFL